MCSNIDGAGRDLDSCKVLFMIAPILGEIEDLVAGARASPRRAGRCAPRLFRQADQVDLLGFDLDKPIADIEIFTNGHELTLEQFKRIVGTRTLRETMADANVTSLSTEPVGTLQRRGAHGRGHGGGRRRRLSVLYRR
jgi:hypothetical protein